MADDKGLQVLMSNALLQTLAPSELADTQPARIQCGHKRKEQIELKPAKSD